MKPNGPAIRAIRTAQGMSLREVAEDCGLAASHVSRIETGEKGATEETLRALARALHCTLEAVCCPEPPAPGNTLPALTPRGGLLAAPVPTLAGIEPLLSAEQVAPLLGVERSTVHRMANSGELGWVPVGRKRRFRRMHVEKYLADNDRPAKPVQVPARPQSR
jgi:excisionase family DNA binding protein